MKSYLTNRKQFVNGGEGIDSILLDLVIGVPQGSVLGPLLFVIFINDIVNCSSLCPVLFADDAAFSCHHNSLKHLQKIMNQQTKQICQWLVTNRLTINVKKTKYMIFHKKRDAKFTRKVKKFRINVNNYCIKQVSEFKYLGVIIDNKLNWQSHINHLCTHISKAVGVIYRLKKLGIPRGALQLIYHSLVSSRLRYGIASWGSASSTVLQKLNMINNKAVRYIKYTSETLTAAYRRMKFFTVKSLYSFEVSKFIHLHRQGELPDDFENFIERVDHSHITRSNTRMNYNLSQPRTELGKSSIRFQGVKIWNSLPNHLQFENITTNFCQNLKIHILDQQETL